MNEGIMLHDYGFELGQLPQELRGLFKGYNLAKDKTDLFFMNLDYFDLLLYFRPEVGGEKTPVNPEILHRVREHFSSRGNYKDGVIKHVPQNGSTEEMDTLIVALKPLKPYDEYRCPTCMRRYVL